MNVSRPLAAIASLYRTRPCLTRLVPPYSPSDAIKRLQVDGAVIVEHLIPVPSISQTLADVKEALQTGFSEYKEGDFFEDKTSRATGLVNLSSAYVHDQLMHPLLQKVAAHFLTSRTEIVEGDESTAIVTEPQANACIALRIDPGAKAQVLHRDDVLHHNFNDAIASWEEPRDLRREASLSMFVAATPSTRETGATRLIPGSHLWGPLEMPREEDATQAELQPGDALLMLSSIYHGGSANISSDTVRVLFQSSVARGTLRQEENMFLTVPVEVIRKYPAEVQKFAGFRIDFPGLGWVDLKDPAEKLAMDA